MSRLPPPNRMDDEPDDLQMEKTIYSLWKMAIGNQMIGGHVRKAQTMADGRVSREVVQFAAAHLRSLGLSSLPNYKNRTSASRDQTTNFVRPVNSRVQANGYDDPDDDFNRPSSSSNSGVYSMMNVESCFLPANTKSREREFEGEDRLLNSSLANASLLNGSRPESQLSNSRGRAPSAMSSSGRGSARGGRSDHQTAGHLSNAFERLQVPIEEVETPTDFAWLKDFSQT